MEMFDPIIMEQKHTANELEESNGKEITLDESELMVIDTSTD